MAQAAAPADERGGKARSGVAGAMKTLPIRLVPGQDLRLALEQTVRSQGCEAAFVLSGVGSLAPALLRLAGAQQAQRIEGDVELLTLSGTVAPDASHLHAALADADGRVFGGHLGRGCLVRTTAEVLLVLLGNWSFERTPDPATGFAELVVRQREPGPQA